jgi:hypothetical protein
LYINFQPIFKKFAFNPIVQGMILQSAPADPRWILEIEANKGVDYAKKVREAFEAYRRNPNEKTLRDLIMAQGYLARSDMASDAYRFPLEYPYTHRALSGGRDSIPFFAWQDMLEIG